MIDILGLGVTAQVGKDTAAEYLEERPGVKRVAFADALKSTASSLFGLSYEQCYGPVSVKEKVDPRYNLTPREIMQGLGEKMREIYPDIWIDTVLNITIPRLRAQGFSRFVISDVRYPNEAEKIKKVGGVVVKVTREGSGVTVGVNHSSETSMQDYTDYYKIIENNGTLDEFFLSVCDLAEEIGWQRLDERGSEISG